MENDVQIVFSPEIYTMQIASLRRDLEVANKTISTLSIQLDYERSLREELEEKVRLNKLDIVETSHPKPVKRTRKQREVTPENNAYCDFKSDGKRKPHAAESIRSYTDFKMIQDYFLEKNKIRDWAMWTIGVSMGLRISDLLSLKFGNLVKDDRKTIRERVQIFEQKTGKLNNILITEAVVRALQTYLDSIHWEFDLNGFLFPSRKTKGKMYEEYGWKILSDAGKALDLPLVIGSHTMRKSFANIAACVDKSCVDMNSVTKVQGLLNHGDQKVTMRYLGAYQNMFDKARIAVSDFVLGKTDVDEIFAGGHYTIDDVFERVDALERLLSEKKDGIDEGT